MAPLRGVGGVFVSTRASPLPPASFRRGQILGRGANKLPYYLAPVRPPNDDFEVAPDGAPDGAPDASPELEYLPSMASLVEAGPEGQRPYLWNPFHARGRAFSLDLLLDKVGEVLESRARADEDQPNMLLRGCKCFARPLLDRDGIPECMLLDPKKIKAAKSVDLMKGQGYARLCLGKIKEDKRVVRESAHRLVLWAAYGPPDPTIKHPVAMHACNNPLCVQPLHLVWGEDEFNVHDPVTAYQEAHKQFKNTRNLDLATWMARLNLNL